VTDTATPSSGHIGDAPVRKEDAKLVTGQTTWTDNITFPGMLYVAALRSPMAHARINSVDVSAALEQPGVVAALTGADLADDWAGPLPCAWPVTPDMIHPDHWPVAKDEVRYVGDAVAVVVARDRFAATDALEHIMVDYEPLDAVVDMEAALADGAPLVHGDQDSNACYTAEIVNGEIDAAFDDAHKVVSRRFIQQRLIPTAIEPRSVVVAPIAAAGEYTLYSSTQIPHILRLMLALTAGVPESKLRVIAPDVGGGFGSKLNVYAEELLALVLAKKLGRPIKWTGTRSEGYQTTIHGRDQIQDIEAAFDEDGRLRGLKVKLLADMGAYLQLVTPGIPLLGMAMFPGIYKMDAYSFGCTGVFTNKTPTDAYRGAGRPEATYGIERMMDEAAVELGMDPMDLRRRNWIAHEEFPYESIGGHTYDSGNYEAATAKAMELFDYDGMRAEQQRRRESGDRYQLGIGISTYTEACGLGPSRFLGSTNYGAGGWETATVRMLPTGDVEVVTGVSPHGQGHETTFSQIVADTLGVPFEKVEVLHGDTRVAPHGLDTYGSRSLAVGGIAVYNAAHRMVDKLKDAAAHMLEASADDVEFNAGQFQVKGAPDTATGIGDVVLGVFASHDLPHDYEASLTAEFTFEPENWSFPHGTHLVAMEVDTETGMPRIHTYVCVDDVGNVINPQIVDGQVHGGLAQGIAQALYEEAVYDEAGNLTTGSLVDYYVPGAPDLPTYITDRTVTPATTNPLGVKGVGEAGTIASTPAIVNGVLDAVRHLGVTDIDMPCSPERVWRALQQGSASRDEIAPEGAEGGQHP
jgi:carbon-monoxide dehydrogenase large subunit